MEKIQLHSIKNNMFNGIIFNQGVVKKIKRRPKGINIFVKSNLKLTKKEYWYFNCYRWCLLNINKNYK